MPDSRDTEQPHSEPAKILELLREDGELPEAYGRTCVTLTPVSPFLLHVYWEVSPEDLEKARRAVEATQRWWQPALRFYDITYLTFNGTNAHSSFDVDIDVRAGNWYVPLWSAEKSYVLDLGFRTDNGEFYSLARSNCADIPPVCPFARAEERTEENPEGVEQPAEQHQEPAGTFASAAEIVSRIDDGPVPPQVIEEVFHTGTEAITSPPQAESRDAYLLPQPVDAALSVRRRYSELYPFLMKDRPVMSTKEQIVLETIRRNFDLTELSERRFSPGISSIVFSHGRWGAGGPR